MARVDFADEEARMAQHRTDPRPDAERAVRKPTHNHLPPLDPNVVSDQKSEDQGQQRYEDELPDPLGVHDEDA